MNNFWNNLKNGNVKYVSIRIKPSREDIKKAEALYATLD